MEDILHSADKMFVSITVNQAQQAQDDFLLEWDNVLQAGIDIGKNKFSITDVQRKVGVMVALLPPDAVVATDAEEVAEEASIVSVEVVGEEGVRKKKVTVAPPEKTKDSTRRSGSKLSRLSLDINNPDKKKDDEGSLKGDASSKDAVVEAVVVGPDELKSMLAEWDTKEEDCEAVLETPFFKVALWKQNQKYFLFDPKACDSEKAGLTEKRVKMYEKLIKERNDKAEAARLILEQQKQAEADANKEPVPSSTSLDKPTEKSAEKLPLERTSKVSQMNEILKPIAEEVHSATESPTTEPEPPVVIEPEDLDESPDASCALLRFTTLDNMLAYILQLVPHAQHIAEVVLVQPQIECRPLNMKIETLSFNYFKHIPSTVSDPYWMIRASMSQNDQIFPAPSNRNRQDAAISITALSMATFCGAEDWTPVILDVILKYGDRLYTKSFQQYKLDNAADKLNLYQVISPFVLANVKFSFNVEFYASGDMLAEPGNTNIRSVFDVLNDFLGGGASNGRYGVLVTRQYFVSVWRDENSFYLFDSHEMGPDGKRCTLGVACLCRFMDVSSMAKAVLDNMNLVSSDFTSFQLYNVSECTVKDISFECGILCGFLFRSK